MGPDRRGELHFVVKPTRLSVVRDLAVIAVCVMVLAVLVVELCRSEPAGALQVLARSLQGLAGG